jgi:hypothetical protein
MGLLKCKLFTESPRDESDRLERCAVNDADHVTPGTKGGHVKRIQIALNQLSMVFLAIDGDYGPKTASAVRAFKEAQTPPLRQRYQSIADQIVGIGTIKALDEQMVKLEKAPTRQTGFVSEDHLGSPANHDHARICVPFLDAAIGPDKLISHIATPINPQRTGRMVSIGGTNEVKYLGFENFMPDPDEDSDVPPFIVLGRPKTSSIPSHTCSDICFRSAPVDKFMREGNGRPSKADGKINRGELRRIAMPGCRLTVALSNPVNLASLMPFLLSLGPQIQFTSIPDGGKPNIDPDANPFSGVPVVVFSMLNVF